MNNHNRPAFPILLRCLAIGVMAGVANAVLFYVMFSHVFFGLHQLTRWAAQMVTWYGLGALGLGLIGIGISAFGRTVLNFLAEDRSELMATGLCVSAALAFWLGMVLNFRVLSRPAQPDLLHVSASLVLAAVTGTLVFAALIYFPDKGHKATATKFEYLAAITFMVSVLIGQVSSETAQSLARPQVEQPIVESGKDLDRNRSNLLLITVDTLRADHLGMYGYPRDTSPALDQLASEGVIFEAAFTQKPITSPGMASLITGTYPVRHGIDNTSQVLSKDLETLAEILENRGYSTSAIVTNGNLYPLYQFDQGFQEYVYKSYEAEEQTDAALEWLDASIDEPFFLWIHYADPHAPYGPPAPFDTLFVNDEYYESDHLDPKRLPATYSETIEKTGLPQDRSLQTDTAWYLSQYDGEIRYADQEIGRLVDAFKQRDSLDNTLLVFSSDHGESFGEGEYYGHGQNTHDSNSQIPLFMRLPTRVSPGQREDAIVNAADVVPTILNLLAIEKPALVQGRDRLTDGGRSNANREESFALINGGFGEHIGPGLMKALRTPEWKYVWRDTDWATSIDEPADLVWLWNAALEGGLSRDELYDLTKDPGETTNLIEVEKDRAAELKLRLITEFEKLGPEGPKAKRIDRDQLKKENPEILESLKALGYL